MQHRLKLKFPDEATAIEVLSDFRGIDEEGDEMWLTGSHIHALLPVGILSGSGTYDDEGNELTPPTIYEGWHVELQLETAVPQVLEQYIVNPSEPLIEWFDLHIY